MAAVDNFWNDYQGKWYVSFDGVPANAGQCVQPVGFYTRDYLKYPVLYANAVNWYTDFESSPLAPNFTKIPNSPNNAPEKGDIVVWAGNLPNSGGAGHIAVCWSNSPGYFVSIDSNWAGKYVHMVSHNYDYVLGWLRPKNSQTNTPQGGEAMISDADNEYGRWNKLFRQIRGRNAGRDEFRAAAVGRSWLSAMEILSDSPEADQATRWQETGQVATNDNWPQQIHILAEQLKASQDIANQLNQAVVDAQNANKADLQAALAKVADLTAQLQTSNDKLVDLQNQQAEDQETGNSFLRWLGDQLNKIRGK
jgi:hypothetical protein